MTTQNGLFAQSPECAAGNHDACPGTIHLNQADDEQQQTLPLNADADPPPCGCEHHDR